MKKIVRYFLMVLALLSFAGFIGCESFTPPKSKEVDRGINLFSDFDNIGFAAEKLVINTDYSGYMQYFTTGVQKDENKTKQIMDKIEKINKSAYYNSDSDLQDIYRAVYVQEKSITKPENGIVRVKVEFSNINHLKSGINVQTLESYLDANPNNELNNHYKNLGDKSEVSLYKIDNKSQVFIVTVKNAVNHIPITINDTRVLCYSGDLIEGKNDTIKFSSGDFNIVVGPKHTERWLIISAAVLAFAFIVLIAVKFVLPKKNRG